VLCYGDSLTAGFCAGGRVFEPYGQALAEALAAASGRACEVSVCGHTGHQASEMVANLDSERVEDIARRCGKGLRRLLDEEPALDLVIVMAGTNDIGYERFPREVFADVRQLHAACHARGIRTIVLPPPPAPVGAGTKWEQRQVQVKELLAEWARSSPFVAAFIDPGELVPPSVGSAWDPDSLHYSPAGSRLLGRRLAPLLLPMLSKATPAALSTPRAERRNLRAAWGGC